MTNTSSASPTVGAHAVIRPVSESTHEKTRRLAARDEQPVDGGIERHGKVRRGAGVRPGRIDGLAGEIDGSDAAIVGQVDVDMLSVGGQLEGFRMRRQGEAGAAGEVEAKHRDRAAAVAGKQLLMSGVVAKVVGVAAQRDIMKRLEGMAVEAADGAVAAAGNVDGSARRHVGNALGFFQVLDFGGALALSEVDDFEGAVVVRGDKDALRRRHRRRDGRCGHSTPGRGISRSSRSEPGGNCGDCWARAKGMAAIGQRNARATLRSMAGSTFRCSI